MKKYLVLQAMSFHPGVVLGLEPSQAAIRAHALEKKGKNTYVVKSRVEFKAGEIVYSPSALPKDHAESLEPVDSKRAVPSAEAQEQARIAAAAEAQEPARIAAAAKAAAGNGDSTGGSDDVGNSTSQGNGGAAD